MTVYQLVASGPGQVLDGTRRYHSKQVFLSRERAELYRETFREKCTTIRENDLDAIESGKCRIKVIELLVDEEAGDGALRTSDTGGE